VTPGATTGRPEGDRFDAARAVADAVLYEGYVLYPYRASASKNRVRFQWGVLTPRPYGEADGSERWRARTECLLRRDDTDAAAVVRVRMRCLQTQRRRVEATDDGSARGSPAFRPVSHLELDGTRHVEWDEAVDRVVDPPPLVLPPDLRTDVATETVFTLDGGVDIEDLRNLEGSLRGRFVRERQPTEGAVRIAATALAGGTDLVMIAVEVENTSNWGSGSVHRDEAMARSLVAVHTMLAADGAHFVSLLDPPPDAADAAGRCRSEGTYPVLVGDETLVLSSPIILYDHPELAPQSPGDLYDALEIDEILALRVMTLTDAEKSEARGTDPRAAAIVDRCDSLSPEALAGLHGQMRPVQPEAVPWWDPASDESVDPGSDTVRVGGTELGQGSRVRLKPSGRADAQDMFLRGRSATVAGIFGDVDGGFHLAVVLDDDPAAAELVWQGRYLYFHPDEVEPLAPEPAP
jgi:hypothetical protein